MSSTAFLNPVFNNLQMDFNKSSILLQDGNEVDNSWELRIQINGIGEITVRVNGSFTIGTVMHCIAEQTENYQINWSDYALWWSQKNIWLLQTRRSLDQYNIQSDALLEFRSVHGKIKIVLPSLKTVEMQVNFSTRVFQVVIRICKHLSIRYPEELSLMFPIKKNHLRQNCVMPVIGHGKVRRMLTQRSNSLSVANHNTESKMQLNTIPPPLTPKLMSTNINNSGFNTIRSNNLSLGDLSTINRQSERHLNNNLKSTHSLDYDQVDANQYSLCNFRMKPSMAIYEGWIHRPKNVLTKARMNFGWLDSSRSLMEHGIISGNDNVLPTLYLRFKYSMFYDLNPKYDTVRIHQIYEQARWDILTGNIDCTEEEMIIFAACQLQAEHETTLGNYPDLNEIYNGTMPRSPYPNSNTMLSNNNNNYNQFDTLDTNRYNNRQNNFDSSSNSATTNYNVIKTYEDQIDYLLNEIEDSCRINFADNGNEFTTTSESPINSTGRSVLSNIHPEQGTMNTLPELRGKLKVCRDNKINFIIRRYKSVFLIVRETAILGFKRESDTLPIFAYTLKDCNVTYDVDCHSEKYIINLSLLSDPLDTNGAGMLFSQTQATGNPDPFIDNNNSRNYGRLQREYVSIKCETNDEFATWIAAFRLGSIGRTIGNVEAFERDKTNTLELLKLQLNNNNLEGFDSELVSMLNDLSFYCSEKILAKTKSLESLKKRILKAHIGLRELSVNSSKMKYIYTWQRLPTFGKNYFLVTFDKAKTIDPPRGTAHLFGNPLEGGTLVAVSHGRFEILSHTSGEVLRSWNFSEFKSWTVNWQSNSITLHFTNGKVEFRPLIGNCKTFVEFIGGYVFLSQRTPDKNQELNERFFHKLTGVTDLEQIALGEK